MQNTISRLTSDLRRLFVDLKQEPRKRTFKRLKNRFFQVTRYIIYYLDLTKELKQLEPLSGDTDVRKLEERNLNVSGKAYQDCHQISTGI